MGEALKRGGTEKRERETKMLKRRWGKLGQGVGALKRRGGGVGCWNLLIYHVKNKRKKMKEKTKKSVIIG